ncbi:DUF4760 domain-containing protein [Pseudomonas sp. ABC1]|uniref:DUF4760 domain-containing protein n=1 Tax=Pseudomonas sp. ABC1 TaxID=2748080 RepID=UPI0015C3292A|nr:DUF4760 domain-containing protein [Pseudomonas sp. ABC1]QLF92296.1 DUF4760 domain-containing protein [Pseudomonas sp. ABC1]
MEILDLLCRFSASTAANNLILLGGVCATVLAIRSAKTATIATLNQNRESTLATLDHNRTVAKQKETALLMFNSRTDDMLRSGYRTIRQLHTSPNDNIVTYATDPEKRNSDDADKIRYVLNHWERTAVCVAHEIYCEEILKNSMYTTVVNVYEQAEPFIREIRKVAVAETLYQDFEKMVKRWKAAPIKKQG